jgi:hypothetical protein
MRICMDPPTFGCPGSRSKSRSMKWTKKIWLLHLRRLVASILFNVQIQRLVTLKSDMAADPNPHGFVLVWLPVSGCGSTLGKKAGSGSALKPMRIHNTAFLQMFTSQRFFFRLNYPNNGNVILCLSLSEKKKIHSYLEACLVHDLVVPDDLDGHLLVTSRTVPGSEYKKTRVVKSD